MNIDYRVRNSIYCTPASRALSAAQLLNGPSHARLTISPFFAAHVLRRKGLQAQRPRATDRQAYWTFQQLATAFPAPPGLHGANRPEQRQNGPKDACLSSAEPANAELALRGVEPTTYSARQVFIDYNVRTQVRTHYAMQPKRNV
jgi:hypothetical protein